jgi:hypothetical protein
LVETGNTPASVSRPPTWLFILELAYVAVLVLAAVLYNKLEWAKELVPDPAGPVPLGVPWWGALGGVAISLTGIFRNAKNWDPTYNLWHVARPVLGAIFGTVGYLIFIVVIRSTGADVGPNSTNKTTFYLIAFIIGYREALFRELLKRAADTLFAPGDSSQ